MCCASSKTSNSNLIGLWQHKYCNLEHCNMAIGNYKHTIKHSHLHCRAQEISFVKITTFHWMFGVSALLLYATLLVHTFLSKWNDNVGNITLATVSFIKLPSPKSILHCP